MLLVIQLLALAVNKLYIDQINIHVNAMINFMMIWEHAKLALLHVLNVYSLQLIVQVVLKVIFDQSKRHAIVKTDILMTNKKYANNAQYLVSIVLEILQIALAASLLIKEQIYLLALVIMLSLIIYKQDNVKPANYLAQIV